MGVRPRLCECRSSGQLISDIPNFYVELDFNICPNCILKGSSLSAIICIPDSDVSYAFFATSFNLPNCETDLLQVTGSGMSIGKAFNINRTGPTDFTLEITP